MRATAPCPGTVRNGTVLLTDLDATFGIIWLRNAGSVGVAVGGVDRKGNLLQPHIYLQPGEWQDSYVPPEGTYKLIMVGANNTGGMAVLDYDVPWWV